MKMIFAPDGKIHTDSHLRMVLLGLEEKHGTHGMSVWHAEDSIDDGSSKVSQGGIGDNVAQDMASSGSVSKPVEGASKKRTKQKK